MLVVLCVLLECFKANRLMWFLIVFHVIVNSVVLAVGKHPYSKWQGSYGHTHIVNQHTVFYAALVL